MSGFVSEDSRAHEPRRRLQGHHFALLAVLALASFLDLWRLSQNGYANSYYSAAVRSMLQSWHNFFFVSFDPGGLVSVDKPPLALWLQAASAKLFGYSSWSLLLPEALAGIVAVWLLYLLVTRYFGRVAGLVAALALAVSPVSVAVNRDNNPDALFACLLVAAVYVGARAIESGRIRPLLLSALLIGLAFNTKMLAAALVIPGLFLAYLLFAPGSRRLRLGRLALAGVALAVVSGAWIAAVDLTPAGERPYVGSTTNNSALSLALGYNGLGRVTGQEGGTSIGGGGGGAFSGSPGLLRLFNNALGDQGGWLLPLAIVGGIAALALAWRLRNRRELLAITAVGGWFVCAAVIFSYSSGIIHTYYLSALAPASCALVGIGAVSLWRGAGRGGRWLALAVVAVATTALAEMVILRRSGHLSWLQVLVVAAALAAIAILVGVASAQLSRRAFERGSALALAIAVAGFLAAPTAWSATTLNTAVNGTFPGAGPNYSNGQALMGGGGGRAGGAPSVASGKSVPSAVGSAAGPANGGVGFPTTGGSGRQPTPPQGGLAAPGATAPGGQLPRAGKLPSAGTLSRGGSSLKAPSASGAGARQTLAGGAMPGSGGNSSSQVSTALKYVLRHGATKRFALIVTSEQEAAPFVIKGDSVAAMGGFTGRETVLTSSYLARLVAAGQARYFLLSLGGGFGGGSASNSAIKLITTSCKKLKASTWSGSSAKKGRSSPATGASSALYDCAGRAAEISGANG